MLTSKWWSTAINIYWYSGKYKKTTTVAAANIKTKHVKKINAIILGCKILHWLAHFIYCVSEIKKDYIVCFATAVICHTFKSKLSICYSSSCKRPMVNTSLAFHVPSKHWGRVYIGSRNY